MRRLIAAMALLLAGTIDIPPTFDSRDDALAQGRPFGRDIHGRRAVVWHHVPPCRVEDHREVPARDDGRRRGDVRRRRRRSSRSVLHEWRGVDPGHDVGAAADKREPRFWNRLYRNLGDWKFEDVTERSGLAGTRYDFGAAVGDDDNDGDIDLHVTGSAATRSTAIAGTAPSPMSRSRREPRAGMVVERGVCGLRPRRLARSLRGSVPRLVVGIKSRLPVGGRHRTRLLSPAAVPARFERAAPQQRRRHLQRRLSRGRDRCASRKGAWCRHPRLRPRRSDRHLRRQRLDAAVPLPEHRSAQGGRHVRRSRGRGRRCLRRRWAELCRHGHRLRGLRQRWLAGPNRHDAEPGALRAVPRRDAAASTTPRTRRVSAAQRVQNSGWGTKFVDFDNDGAPRSVRGAGPRARHRVTRATGLRLPSAAAHAAQHGPLDFARAGASFVDVSASLGPTFGRPAAGRGAAFADLDDDGDIDIVIANLDAEPTLLRNEGGNANHWLTVSLRGTRSNRDGIGAVVGIVDEQGRAQSGICSTASSYQSGNDRRVHFGLADAKTVRRIEVRWPSGTVQMLKDIAVNRILEIVEPSLDARQRVGSESAKGDTHVFWHSSEHWTENCGRWRRPSFPQFCYKLL